MQLRAGEQINHYTLLEPLGEGGQGSVWKIVDPRDGGVVRALKLISLAETGPSGFDRARREARILADARHPALVLCHSLFEEPRDGVVGLVMDLVEGCSLAEALTAKRLDPARGRSVLAQLADALAHVHGAGLSHRDLKPENVLLTDGFWSDPNRPGTVKLVDFGIAKATASSGATLTAPGAVIGTVPYLAPELLDPATWGRQEGPTRDTFAFGVLACRILLDRHPTGLGFEAAMIDYARAYKAAEAGRIAWPPAGLEGGWAAVVSGCLALRPADRLADGAAVVEVLRTGALSTRQPSSAAGPTTPHRAALEGAPTEVARPISARTQPAPWQTIAAGPAPHAVVPPPPPTAPPRSRGWIWAALLVVGLGSAAGGAAAFAHLGGSSQTAGPQPIPPPAAEPAPAPANDGLHLTPCRNPSIPFDASDTRYACPPCSGTAPPLPVHDWMMHIHGATVPSTWVGSAVKICAQARNDGPAICAPFAVLPDRTGATGRIPVTSAEVDGGRVYFTVRDAANHVLPGGQGFGKRRVATHFLQSGLCQGFILVFGDPQTTVSVFLDEP
jgi:serine/threonine-protein kinase